MTSFRPPAERARNPPGAAARFPGFDVLAQARDWDQATAGVVLERLSPTTQLAFFTAHETSVARPLLGLLMGQDAAAGRVDQPSVPVLELIDTRLARGETDGWHYDDLPEDGEAWRQTLRWLDEDARERHHQGFAHLSGGEQAELLHAVQDLAHQARSWHEFPAGHVWSLWTRYACTAFYSHPWAWNEIGFGGPAYPRGYLNLGIDRREHWEVADAGEQS